MFRFFTEKIFEDNLELSKEDSHHFLDVLRINEHEKVEVVAGNGKFIACLEDVVSNRVVLKKLDKITEENESEVNLSLAFGILKNNNTEEVLKYATEVGVKEFYPLYTKRVVSNISGKEDKKLYRWEKIVESAAKQSKRDVIPIVHSPINLKDIEKISEGKKLIVAYESEKKMRFDNIMKKKDMLLIIGPEGGFEEEEIQFLKNLGAYIISLGNRTLRAQTAAICASFYIIHSLERS
ncbi:RNA methyltransferase, RsmE family [Peptoniphilus sp. ING2-D1G]|nr:RNA methyltransferase, RsmE family [Peptoniphilus sp. ING2-D1G]